MRAALPRTRATSKISCERTRVRTPLRMSAPGAVTAKDGWSLWKCRAAVGCFALDFASRVEGVAVCPVVGLDDSLGCVAGLDGSIGWG
jgi:hypothetical protein